MDHKTEVREFLVTRRARITPERAGLPAYGGNRRVPALVRNGRFDVLGANVLGEALYSELYEDPARPVNHARFIFLDPRAPRFWDDWDRAARDTVSFLRSEAGRNPYDRGLTDLVGELSTRSELFRMLSASEDALKLLASWAATCCATPAPAVDRA